ncbi:MAG: SigE family RNA polymerase sigma factor [Marmoricola sp.]
MTRDDSFSEYVTAGWSRLVRSAILFGCSESEAQDLVQTTLERCLIHWRKVERASDRDAYVHRILLNTFVASRRRRWSGEIAMAEVPDHAHPDQTMDVDQAEAVERGLARLPHDQRVVVVLRYYAHLSEQQMSAVLDVPAGTIKSRLSRALTTLAADPSLEELRDVQ